MAEKPPTTKVSTLAIPYRALVLRADPEFEQRRRKEPFYEFSNGRRFDENTARQGPYSDLPNQR